MFAAVISGDISEMSQIHGIFRNLILRQMQVHFDDTVIPGKRLNGNERDHDGFMSSLNARLRRIKQLTHQKLSFDNRSTHSIQ